MGRLQTGPPQYLAKRIQTTVVIFTRGENVPSMARRRSARHLRP
jgi:hypothetical protein